MFRIVSLDGRFVYWGVIVVLLRFRELIKVVVFLY